RPDAAQGSASGIGFVQTERGGDITYHGPGQLVVYGIIGLREWDIRPLDYVRGLEEVVIGMMADLGLQGERSQLGRGVWAGGAKVASVGINVRRGVSMHGIAVNVTADLSPFGLINPCGMADVQMTSLAALLGHEVPMNRAEELFLDHFRRVFECGITTGPLPAHVDLGEETARA
ncbi:MAG TPA: lipoyl(octanoyl) transferase LipB, partial [Tepidiformaceae bacterium]|nr:lipoyl(octanoyl) transferase LipB [Tepidiformaceae bacterium]